MCSWCKEWCFKLPELHCINRRPCRHLGDSADGPGNSSDPSWNSTEISLWKSTSRLWCSRWFASFQIWSTISIDFGIGTRILPFRACHRRISSSSCFLAGTGFGLPSNRRRTSTSTYNFGTLNASSCSFLHKTPTAFKYFFRKFWGSWKEKHESKPMCFLFVAFWRSRFRCSEEEMATSCSFNGHGDSKKSHNMSTKQRHL